MYFQRDIPDTNKEYTIKYFLTVRRFTKNEIIGGGEEE